jgi:putative oxidoreductase
MTDMTNGTTGRNGWTIGLWAAQVLLALFYLYAGYNKLTQPIDALATMGMGFVLVVPELLTRFIGLAEVLGAAGLILPAATRILPRLTPLAALGLSTIQVLAILLHASRGEFMVLPMNLVLLALSLFVLWGRERKAPISAR